MNEIIENDILVHKKRIEVTGRNAFACSLFFSKMLKLFMEDVLCFDNQNEKPKKEKDCSE